MADLTTAAAVKRQLGIGVQGTINTTDDDLIAVYVSEASQLIEAECQRVFSPTVGTLYFDARYPVVDNNVLYFDQDWLGIDALSNGTNGTLNPAAYRLLPLHYSPKYAVQLLASSNLAWQVGNDGYARNAICVIGTQGFATSTPADITLAATRLAVWLYQTRDNDGSAVQLADGSMVIPANAPTFVIRTISKYIRRTAVSDGAYS